MKHCVNKSKIFKINKIINVHIDFTEKFGFDLYISLNLVCFLCPHKKLVMLGLIYFSRFVWKCLCKAKKELKVTTGFLKVWETDFLHTHVLRLIICKVQSVFQTQFICI